MKRVWTLRTAVNWHRGPELVAVRSPPLAHHIVQMLRRRVLQAGPLHRPEASSETFEILQMVEPRFFASLRGVSETRLSWVGMSLVQALTLEDVL